MINLKQCFTSIVLAAGLAAVAAPLSALPPPADAEVAPLPTKTMRALN